MQGELPTKASTPTGAVFLSYASQDTGAAQRICETLRAAGIEVWFDRSELRGGDAWDHKIRDQIHDCRLFIPVISAHTERRDEGYFRREWSLAVDRTRDMVHKRAFLVPVVIDGTPERGAAVPDKFHELQWTRLPGGETHPAFVDRIRRLLTPDSAPAITAATPSTSGPISVPSIRRSAWPKATISASSALVAIACAYFVADKFWLSRYAVAPSLPAATAAQQTGSPAGAAPTFNPPSHSIAVLPFVNMSGDKEQEYFSDGMTEELITALSQMSSLKVIARTSSFAFKGRNVDTGAIARALNVSAILEGSVRRTGSQVRVTVQLINGSDGFHVWSQDYDRQLRNILSIQSDIAMAVARRLQARLLGDEPSKIEDGNTQNPEAYDAYLRGKQLYRRTGELDHAITLLQKAVQLDPKFARAWVCLSKAYSWKAELGGVSASSWLAPARTAAETALRLDPRLPQASAVMAWAHAHELNWKAAQHDVAVAEALDATDSATLNARANLSFQLGQWEDAIATAHAEIERDPLSSAPRYNLAAALSAAGQHREAERVYRQAGAVQPLEGVPHDLIASEILLDHRPSEALTEAQLVTDEDDRDSLLVQAYYDLGRRDDSDQILARLQPQLASNQPYSLAYLHAYRGETDLAFHWLDRALSAHDPTLFVIKGNIGTLANINRDPRYGQFLKKMGLPVP